MRNQSLITYALCNCIAFVIATSEVTAQLPIFNSDFVLAQHIRTKGELGDSLGIMGIVDRSYNIQGTKVIEYYEMNTSRFLGFAGDTTMFDLRKLPYLYRTPMMRRLVEQFGPKSAHDIRQGKIVAGILQKDILELYKWPKQIQREESSVLWIYDEFVLEFEHRVLIRITKQGS